jgi:hypothetical protein
LVRERVISRQSHGGLSRGYGNGCQSSQGTTVESIKKCRKLGHLPLKTGENPAKTVVFSELYKKKYDLNEFIIIIKNATNLN